jgi:hypothetical protein
MKRFEYRQPRVSADLPIKFITLHTSCAGKCIDISKQGMRIEASQSLLLNACGKVSIRYQDRTLEFNMRVVHVEETSCGLEFLYESNEEQNEVAHLVASLAVSPQRPTLVLVHGA